MIYKSLYHKIVFMLPAGNAKLMSSVSRLGTAIIVLLFLVGSPFNASLLAQTTITTPVAPEAKGADEAKIRIRRTRPVDENKIRNIEQKRKGSNIFGLFLGGVSGVFNWQTLDSSIQAGRLTDDISGNGLGAMFDFNLAGGSLDSIGVRRAGKWYWHFGLHMNLDFVFASTSLLPGTKNETTEDISIFSYNPLIKYYYSLADFSKTRNIPVLNRFTFWAGLGVKWNIAIHDEIENKAEQEIREGITESDTYFSFGFGFYARITEDTWFHFDLIASPNLTASIQDGDGNDLVPDSISGGSDTTIHMGLAYKL